MRSAPFQTSLSSLARPQQSPACHRGASVWGQLGTVPGGGVSLSPPAPWQVTGSFPSSGRGDFWGEPQKRGAHAGALSTAGWGRQNACPTPKSAHGGNGEAGSLLGASGQDAELTPKHQEEVWGWRRG